MTAASTTTIVRANNADPGSWEEISPLLPCIKSPELSTGEYRGNPADVVALDGSNFFPGSWDKKSGWFRELARFLSPKKPAAALHHLTGAPESTCDAWTRFAEPPALALRNLLLGADGVRIFLWLVRKAPNSPLAKQVEYWREAAKIVDDVGAVGDRAASLLKSKPKQIEFSFEGRAE